jgi:putative transposase
MTKYHNKYRTETTRLQGWDYGSPSWYFVTINTQRHVKYFGDVKDGKMYLNPFGIVVEKYWMEIPRHFENIQLDCYVITPNHIPGIIIITNNIKSTGCLRGGGGSRDVACNVSTGDKIVMVGNTSNDKNIALSNISPKNGTLPTAVRSFKSAVTNYANKNNIADFSWQERYYDMIIRNEKELFNIRNYIIQNPARWRCEKS